MSLAAALAIALGFNSAVPAISHEPAIPAGRDDFARPPARLWAVVWHQALAEGEFLEWKPREPGGPAVDPATGAVVVGTRDGILRAVDADGTRRWAFAASGPFEATPLIAGNVVYAGCSDGRVYAVDMRTGAERWRYDTHEEASTTPVLSEGGLYVATLQGTLFALDAASGAWRWHHRRDHRRGSPFEERRDRL